MGQHFFKKSTNSGSVEEFAGQQPEQTHPSSVSESASRAQQTCLGRAEIGFQRLYLTISRNVKISDGGRFRFNCRRVRAERKSGRLGGRITNNNTIYRPIRERKELPVSALI